MIIQTQMGMIKLYFQRTKKLQMFRLVCSTKQSGTVKA